MSDDPDERVLKVSTDAIVDSLCPPVVGANRLGNDGGTLEIFGSSKAGLSWARRLCLDGGSSGTESKSLDLYSSARLISFSLNPIKSNGLGADFPIDDSPLNASNTASFRDNFLADFGEAVLRVAGLRLRPDGEIGGEFSMLGRVSRFLCSMGDGSGCGSSFSSDFRFLRFRWGSLGSASRSSSFSNRSSSL